MVIYNDEIHILVLMYIPCQMESNARRLWKAFSLQLSSGSHRRDKWLKGPYLYTLNKSLASSGFLGEEFLKIIPPDIQDKGASFKVAKNSFTAVLNIQMMKTSSSVRRIRTKLLIKPPCPSAPGSYM